MRHTKSRTNRSIYGILAVVVLRALAKHLGVDATEYGVNVDDVAFLLQGGLGAAAIYFRTHIKTPLN